MGSYSKFILGKPQSSLSNIRLQVERLSVGSNFATGDDSIHAFQGHLIAAACDCLGVEFTDEPIEYKPTKGRLQSIAETIVWLLYFLGSSDDAFQHLCQISLSH